jgi:hypothetical protein
MAIVTTIKPPRNADPIEMERFLRLVCDRLGYLKGTGNPVTNSVAPRFNGDLFFESSSGDWWKATGITSADWEQITFAAGTVGDHGTLVGLGDDDHAQYLKEKASGGTAAEIPVHTHASSAEAGVLDGQYTAMGYFFGVM